MVSHNAAEWSGTVRGAIGWALRGRLKVGIGLGDDGTGTSWKLHDEGRAPAHLALDLDRAAVALHDAEAHREPETGPAHVRLGRKERLENPVDILRRDPPSPIDHPHLHHVAARGRADGEGAAAVFHDVDSVINEVEEHLLDPGHVALHRGEPRRALLIEGV